MFKQNFKVFFNNLTSWLLLSAIIGIPIGLASAIFLYSLDFVTFWREENLWIITFLPLAGLLIGYVYSTIGKQSAAGTNLIFKEYFIPTKILDKLMAPLILIATLLTHLVGAPAGREGTAIQIGAAIADRFHFLGAKFHQNRSLFLLAGVGAGFASLFGTPWAGAIFAVEIFRQKGINWSGIIPAIFTAFVAYWTCLITQAPHTHYNTIQSLDFEPAHIIYTIAVAVIFGMCALLYIRAHHIFTWVSIKLIPNSVLRPFYGGILLCVIFMVMGNTRHMGLGLPIILESFEQQMHYTDFIIKLLLTAFTLAFGFKGGEVTPLFFIGATLGSALSIFVPIPIALMAAMGFLAVFAGVTNTFLACSVMGLELFGWEAFPYFLLSCFIAQIFSGKKSIYENINNSILLTRT